MLWLLCCLPVLTGCIGEEDYANDPVGNFEQLWKIIDEQYCFLEAKGIDWDAVHDKYSPLIIPTMSNDDLFDILSQMLYILKDGHVNLSSAKRTSFYDEWYQGYDWNYREDILYQTYLGSASPSCSPSFFSLALTRCAAFLYCLRASFSISRIIGSR